MKNNKVAHYIQDYLRLTTIWIYSQIDKNTEYQHVVLAHNADNLDRFPVEKIYIASQQGPIPKRLDKLIYRIRGYLPTFCKTLKKENPNLIHAHFGHIGYKAVGLKKKLGIPLVTTFYGYDVSKLAKQKKYQQRYRKLFMEGDCFLVEGTNMGKELQKLGCPAEKIKVFHLGVDINKIDFQERTKSSENNVKLLFAATLTEKKGLKYLIEALPMVIKESSNIQLDIIGEGEEKDNIEKLIEKLGVGEYIQWSGYIPYNDLKQMMYGTDIFIQPSVTASDGNTEGGAPVSLIDAQASGLPVISTFHADIPEVVLNEKTGLLSAEKDVTQLAENIIRLVKNESLRKELGNNGRKHVEENYNMNVQGKVLAKIYHEISVKC